MKRFMKFFVNKVPENLGRWSLEYNQKVVGRKVSLANEDHCSCDYYITQKRKELLNKQNTKK